MTSKTGLLLGIGLTAGDYGVFKVADASPPLLDRLDRSADLITLEDGYARAKGDGPDAILLANWLGSRTRTVGVIAGAPLNFLEPFHVSTAIATLDYVTEGRAGLLLQSLKGERATEARLATGSLNGFPDINEQTLDQDLAEAIDVVRQLWDSWEDDAVIRDKESQRFIDGAKLRYIDFKGGNFSVLGPSITPRPPQGQPIVASSVGPQDDPASAASSDLIFLSGKADQILALSREISARFPEALRFADIEIATAIEPDGLLGRARQLNGAGFAGIRLVVTDAKRDLGPLLDQVIPALRDAGIAAATSGTTLRQRLGLPAARNRHVAAAA
ncbi:LLM class flavin-dependent oxidoreductase [Rhizobium puerariae]|uniref:LLM class flavin-dependent oxidoreductase n=1 Tax=Rhizobium puerariae TaxID=1585791 RepID=A0ABV6ACK5_9HYPH